MWSRVSVVSPSAMNIYCTTQNNLLIFFSRVLEAPCCPTLGNDTTHMRGVNTAQRRVAHARGSMCAWCARIERERPFSRDQRRNKFRHYGRLSWQKVICPLTLFRVCLIVQECVIKERRNISVNKFNIGVRSLWNTKHDTKRPAFSPSSYTMESIRKVGGLLMQFTAWESEHRSRYSMEKLS